MRKTAKVRVGHFIMPSGLDLSLRTAGWNEAWLLKHIEHAGAPTPGDDSTWLSEQLMFCDTTIYSNRRRRASCAYPITSTHYLRDWRCCYFSLHFLCVLIVSTSHTEALEHERVNGRWSNFRRVVVPWADVMDEFVREVDEADSLSTPDVYKLNLCWATL